MKSNTPVRQQAARNQSIDRNRSMLERSLAEAMRETPRQAAARKRMEAYQAFEPLLRLVAGELRPGVWGTAIRLANQGIESLVTGASRVTAVASPDATGLSTETPGATPDFKAGRDL